MKRLYKVLDKNMKSPYKNYQYELGKEYHCPNFDDSDKECSRGLYAVDWDGLSYTYRKGSHVYEVEVWGREKEFTPFKRRYEYIKIVRKLSKKEIKEGLKRVSKEAGYALYHVSFPVNPLSGKPKKVTQKHRELLAEWWSVRESVGTSVWDSVRESVGTSVWVSVWDSVWASVQNSVRDSVRDSVWPSVRASVGAYISSLFPNIKKWKYIDHEEGVNPFQSGIDLWNAGFVPSFDGTTWRLHSGEKAEIVYEWTPEEEIK